MTTANASAPGSRLLMAVGLVLAVIAVVAAIMVVSAWRARTRVAEQTPALASLFHRVRMLASYERDREASIAEIIDANMVSPSLVSQLVRPGDPAGVRWRPMTGPSPPSPMPVLLDADGNAVAVDPDEMKEPLRVGSLVLYPIDLSSGGANIDDWAMVVLAGVGLRDHVVVLRSGDRQRFDDDQLTTRRATLNAQRRDAGLPERPDPRTVPDRLGPG